MIKRNAIVVCNPLSGKGAYKSVLPDLESAMKSARWHYEIAVPSSEDETKKVARESHEKGFDTVIAVGGDGTIHTVLEGMDYTKQALGILPLGSGNDIVRMLKLKDGQRAAIDNIINGGDWRIDIGMCNDTPFLNTAGIGIDSETLKVRRETKGFVKRNYVLLFLKTLGRLKPFRARITADGELIEDDFDWVITCNNNYIGGGMMVAPNAVLDDGLLDLILIRKAPRWKMVMNIPNIFKGTHSRMEEVSMTQVREVYLETDQPMEMGVDGDLACSTPASIKALPRVLRLIKK